MRRRQVCLPSTASVSKRPGADGDAGDGDADGVHDVAEAEALGRHQILRAFFQRRRVERALVREPAAVVGQAIDGRRARAPAWRTPCRPNVTSSPS
jgi:hypothetical protein